MPNRNMIWTSSLSISSTSWKWSKRESKTARYWVSWWKIALNSTTKVWNWKWGNQRKSSRSCNRSSARSHRSGTSMAMYCSKELLSRSPRTQWSRTSSRILKTETCTSIAKPRLPPSPTSTAAGWALKRMRCLAILNIYLTSGPKCLASRPRKREADGFEPF